MKCPNLLQWTKSTGASLGNREQLQEALTNLINNAIKYSKDGGGEVVINVVEEQSHLRVRVVYDGIGIPIENLSHIFDIAYRSP